MPKMPRCRRTYGRLYAPSTARGRRRVRTSPLPVLRRKQFPVFDGLLAVQPAPKIHADRPSSQPRRCFCTDAEHGSQSAGGSVRSGQFSAEGGGGAWTAVSPDRPAGGHDLFDARRSPQNSAWVDSDWVEPGWDTAECLAAAAYARPAAGGSARPAPPLRLTRAGHSRSADGRRRGPFSIAYLAAVRLISPQRRI